MSPSCNKIVLCYITLVNSCLYILHSIYASPVQMNCTFGVCFVTQAGSVFSPEVHTNDSCCFGLLYVNVSRFECLPILTLFVQIPNYFINRVNINPNKHCISFTAHNRSASPFIWEGGMLCLLRVMVNLGNLTPLSPMFATTT